MCLESTHESYPQLAATARVKSCTEVAPAVFSLVLERTLPEGRAASGPVRIPSPACGQFFMLRARPSGVLLGRPISVYHSDADTITFLILKKGPGTAELCAVRPESLVDIIGPIGNRFVSPAELLGSGLLAPKMAPRVALVGGGIGIAPVAGFARELPARSFDFFASFRSATYGLEGLSEKAARLIVTTEDGSSGVKGMLPAVFNAADYDLVYACGPTPMLRYLQSACRDAPNAPLAFLSLEQHMACGAGACLGCTVSTVNGNRRCCVDGPVFNAAEVLL